MNPEREYDLRVNDIRHVNERLSQLLNHLHERRVVLQRQVKAAAQKKKNIESEFNVRGSGKNGLASLEDRLSHAQDSIVKGANISELFQNIIAVCEVHPPQSKVAMDTLASEICQSEALFQGVQQQLQSAESEYRMAHQTAKMMKKTVSENKALHKQMIIQLKSKRQV